MITISRVRFRVESSRLPHQLVWPRGIENDPARRKPTLSRVAADLEPV